MEQKYLLLNEGEIIKWQGLWTAEKEIYAIGDVVAHAKTGYGTCVYKAIVGHVPTPATEPEVGASWETVWDEFLMGGQNGTGEGTGDVLSTGIAGGQTIIGGTGASENLTLQSTAHATRGVIAMLDGVTFPEAAAGKISLYGNRFGATNGYVCGVEASAVYFRSSVYHRWYINCLADEGVSDSMQLSATGLDLPVGLLTPKITLSGPIKRTVLAKTANYVITDTDPDIVVVGALGAHATITLPTVAGNTGRIITVIIGGNPGAYNVIVDGEGAETINGAATKTNSDQYSYLRLLSTGAVWLIVGSAGTWT